MRSNASGRLTSNIKPHLDLLKESWRWRTIREWNEMPEEIRMEKRSMIHFKKKLKAWITSNTPIQKQRNQFN